MNSVILLEDIKEFTNSGETPLNTLINKKLEMFTSNGTFIVPEGVHYIFITAVAGGGGSAGGKAGAQGGDGAQNGIQSGAYACYGPEVNGGSGGKGGDGPGGGSGGNGESCYKYLIPVSPGEVIQITVGIGGSAGRVATSGNNGSNTVIGNKLTLRGGGAGQIASGNPTKGETGKGKYQTPPNGAGAAGTTPSQGNCGTTYGLREFITYNMFKLTDVRPSPAATRAGMIPPFGLFDTYGRGAIGGGGGLGGSGGAGIALTCDNKPTGNKTGANGSQGSAGNKGNNGIVIIEW